MAAASGLRCWAFVLAVLLVVAAGSQAVFAETPAWHPLVAVMPFTFDQAAPDQAAQITQHVHGELAALHRYTLIEQHQADDFMKGVSFHEEACAGVPCAQRLGRDLGVDKVVMGTLALKPGDHWTFTADIVDVRTGTIEAHAAVERDGTFDQVLSVAPTLLVQALSPPSAEPPPVPAGTPKPAESPAPAKGAMDTSFLPHSGFALYTGYSAYSGTLEVKDADSIAYSGGGIPSIGLEYQWALSQPLTLALFFEVSGSGAPSGKLGKLYDSGGPTLGGVELRYWLGRWYVGGNLGSADTCFFDLNSKHAVKDLCLGGTAVGAAGGYQFSNGWFVSTQLESANLNETQLPDDSRVPRAQSAAETDLWVNVGYRWGQ